MNETYVVDTRTFAYYLADRLTRKADEAFKKAEMHKSTIVIPTIAIAELIYILEKSKAESEIWDMMHTIDTYPSFQLHPLDEDILRMIPDVKLKELHDRIIVATCLLLKAEGLITRNSEIKRSGLVKIIW